METTLQKSIFRVFGTVLGGALGFAAMTDTRSAQNPYALMAILCTIAFFASFLTNSPVRMSELPLPCKTAYTPCPQMTIFCPITCLASCLTYLPVGLRCCNVTVYPDQQLYVAGRCPLRHDHPLMAAQHAE